MGTITSSAYFRAFVTTSFTSETETDTLFAAIDSLPAYHRKRAINDVIVALKAAGVWTKLDVLYVFAAHDEDTALINWKNPGTFNCTAVNAPTFVADRGYTGDGASSALDTGFNPSTAGGGFTQNSAHLGAWSLTDIAASNHPNMGNTQATPHILINSRNTSDQASFRINSSTNLTIASTSGAGHFSASRTSSTALTGYINGSAVTAVSGGTGNTSSTLQNDTIRIARWGIFYGERQIAVAHAGASLSGPETLAAYQAFQAYLQSVGAI